jgi:hypothetical protein
VVRAIARPRLTRATSPRAVTAQPVRRAGSGSSPFDDLGASLREQRMQKNTVPKEAREQNSNTEKSEQTCGKYDAKRSY